MQFDSCKNFSYCRDKNSNKNFSDYLTPISGGFGHLVHLQKYDENRPMWKISLLETSVLNKTYLIRSIEKNNIDL